jgi:hypothetical protein
MIRIGIPPKLCDVCDDRPPTDPEHTWCDDCIGRSALPLEDLLAAIATSERLRLRAEGQLILERERRKKAEARLAEVDT